MPENFLDFAVQIALLFSALTFLITVFKVIKGPTLPDRVLALDMLVAAAIGFIAVLGIKTGFTLYLDIAIALGLVGFLATVAFARFILARGQSEGPGEAEDGGIDASNTSGAKPTVEKTADPKSSIRSSQTAKAKTKAKS